MFKKSIFIFSLLTFALCLNGCLTFDSKEYSFKVKSNGSGSGKIKYINIQSTVDSASTSEADYESLIKDYVNGDKTTADFPNAKNFKKRLYEEDNQLCGELTFDFDDITKMKFYKYKEATICYLISSFTLFQLSGPTETYFSSNGTFGNEQSMPVIFWDSDAKELNFKTVVKQDKKSEKLLDLWKQKGDK